MSTDKTTTLDGVGGVHRRRDWRSRDEEKSRRGMLMPKKVPELLQVAAKTGRRRNVLWRV